MPRNANGKPLEWARAARDAFDASIDFIAAEDPFTARRVLERVENALTQIQAHPKIGRPAGAGGRRAFPIPNTGHIVNYRETKSAIRILRWYRSKRNIPSK
jgi:plasmid stabilization system protein ParE